MTQSVASWDSVINLNLWSIFLMSQIVGNAMLARGTGSLKMNRKERKWRK